jgi:hypothetical protein
MQYVPGEAFGVHSSQDAFTSFDLTTDQRKVFLAVLGVGVMIEVELTLVGGKAGAYGS